MRINALNSDRKNRLYLDTFSRKQFFLMLECICLFVSRSFNLDFLIITILEKCEYGNKTLDISQSFITEDCKSRCECQFLDGTTKVNCRNLCSAIEEPKCRPDVQELEEYQLPQEGSNCSCPAKRCVAGLAFFRSN